MLAASRGRPPAGPCLSLLVLHRPAPGAKLWGTGPRLRRRLGPWNRGVGRWMPLLRAIQGLSGAEKWRWGLQSLSDSCQSMPQWRRSLLLPDGGESKEKEIWADLFTLRFTPPLVALPGPSKLEGVLAPRSLLHAPKTLGEPSPKSACSSFRQRAATHDRPRHTCAGSRECCHSDGSPLLYCEVVSSVTMPACSG